MVAKSICERICNVKSSLEKAEQSFRENNGMRGELDLMLAEAEIKHLREKSGWFTIWNRQRLAFFVAAVVVLAGYGGWLYAGMSDEVPTQLQATQVPAAVAAAIPFASDLPQTEAAPEHDVPAFTDKPSEESQKGSIPIYQKEQVRAQRAVDVPTADVRQLVRDARRTLRDAN